MPYCEFVWSELARHAHLPGLVCGTTNKTLLHGEIRFNQVLHGLRPRGQALVITCLTLLKVRILPELRILIHDLSKLCKIDKHSL